MICISHTRKTTKREEAQLPAPLFSGTGNTLPPEMRFKMLHFLLPSGVRSSHTTSRRKTQYITHIYIYIYTRSVVLYFGSLSPFFTCSHLCRMCLAKPRSPPPFGALKASEFMCCSTLRSLCWNLNCLATGLPNMGALASCPGTGGLVLEILTHS